MTIEAGLKKYSSSSIFQKHLFKKTKWRLTYRDKRSPALSGFGEISQEISATE